jgi:hypothetical protein
MSEYWKSTPRYWCKHCKTFVRDTKLERQNHDATPKHQGNLKRFIRDLHRGHEKDAKDKERAKSEVARLNGIVPGSGAGESSSSGLRQESRPSAPKLLPTPSQRKQQLAQLAEMGVSIPEEFRGEMAMAGEWQVTSERIILPLDAERNPDTIGIGVRKRTAQDEDEKEAAEPKRRRWGSNLTAYPREDESDLDALLSRPITKGKGAQLEKVIKLESLEGMDKDVSVTPKAEAGEFKTPQIKKELLGDEIKLPTSSGNPADINIKQGDGDVVFKRRAKAKNIRQK